MGLRLIRKRRWGYVLWGIAGAVIAVPEITAAIDHDALPFTTISEMVGHLERHHTWVELLVVAAIVFGLFSTFRVPPQPRRGRREAAEGEAEPVRTPGGRLTIQVAASEKPPSEWQDETTPVLFALAAVLACATVAVATLAAVIWWDDDRHYHPAYVLYGLLALFWIVIPSVLAFGWGEDLPFPTLFQTVTNLEDWLKGKRSWPFSLGPLLGWLVAYVILAGLAILLLHLALYPYPNITHILNPNG